MEYTSGPTGGIWGHDLVYTSWKSIEMSLEMDPFVDFVLQNKDTEWYVNYNRICSVNKMSAVLYKNTFPNLKDNQIFLLTMSIWKHSLINFAAINGYNKK